MNNKSRQTIILISFWILVGLASGLLYNLEWFIQKVVFFNKWILEKEEVKLLKIKTLEEFYRSLKETKVKEIYHKVMGEAMRKEGIIFSLAGLFAAFISGPVLITFVNKTKNYKLIILPVMIIFAFLICTVAPFLSSAILMFSIFCPIFGIGYGYRTAMDPWSTSVAKRSKISIGFVRIFYEIGLATGTFFMTLYFFKNNYYKKELSLSTALPYYLSALSVLSLAIFIYFLIPNNVFEKSKSKIIQIESKIPKKSKNIKKILFSKDFIIILIVFLILIGIIQAFSSIWVNTVENATSVKEEINNVDHIGYQKLFAAIVRILSSYFILKMIQKFHFKTILLIAAFTSSIAWFLISFLIYNESSKKINMIWVDLIGGFAEAMITTLTISLSYEFISKITTRNNRTTIFVIFNSFTYGMGGIIFVTINTFLSKTSIFALPEGQIVWIAMSFFAFLSFLIIIFFYKDNIEKLILLRKTRKVVNR